MTVEDGEKVYRETYGRLKAGEVVEMDFSGVEIFASPFFNTAMGQLLRDISVDDLQRLVVISNLTEDGVSVLNRVIENAKDYYTNPASRKAVDDMLKAYATEG